MTRERMREIALKYWHLKLRDPNFAKERAKIRRNSARIAGQLGMTSAEFKGFFVMCDFTSTNQLTHDELTGEIGEIALRFTEHRSAISPISPVSSSWVSWFVEVKSQDRK